MNQIRRTSTASISRSNTPTTIHAAAAVSHVNDFTYSSRGITPVELETCVDHMKWDLKNRKKNILPKLSKIPKQLKSDQNQIIGNKEGNIKVVMVDKKMSVTSTSKFMMHKTGGQSRSLDLPLYTESAYYFPMANEQRKTTKDSMGKEHESNKMKQNIKENKTLYNKGIYT